MNIHKALKEIDTLSKEELKHCIQRVNIDIEHYKMAIKNYSPYKMKNYGIPYLQELNRRKKQFEGAYNQK